MPVFICQGKSIYFSHVPKCGGTSVERVLRRNSSETGWISTHPTNTPFLNKLMRCSPQHIHAALADQIFPMSSFDYRFILVRDPVHRIVSKYRMEWGRRKDGGMRPFGTWLEHVFSLYQKNAFVLDNHIRPAAEFLSPDMHVFKLEDGLDAVFKAISNRLEIDIDAARIPHVLSRPADRDISITPTPDEVALISFLPNARQAKC